MIRSYADAGQFMGSVLVVRDGQVMLDKGYGFADIAAKTPNTSNTRFYIASITKQFTAASILLLEDRGKLSTDDPIGKYLTGLPEAWAGIPLKNLLTHTSGIPDYESNQPKTAWASPTTPEQKLAVVSGKSLDFPTDTGYRYSNTNYVLLAMVVEKVSGKPFGKFLQTYIFRPLHMDATRYDVELTSIKGYVSRPGGLEMEAPTPYDHTANFGDSGISTTTHDLLKWQQGLFGGKVLKPASLTKMTTAYKNSHVDGNNGFGLIIRAPRGGLRWIHHSGVIPGFQGNLAWFRDLNMSVIILENVESHPPAPGPDDMRTHIVDVLSGRDVPAPVVHRQVPVSSEVMAVYPGTYELSPDFSITITLENDQLFLQATNQSKFPIFPETETRFFLKAVEAQIEFVKGPDGKVTSLILHQDGKDTPGVRK